MLSMSGEVKYPTQGEKCVTSRGLHHSKGPATRNDFVNDIVNDARADAIFATLKAIVDDEKSTISSTISLRVEWPLEKDNSKNNPVYRTQV